MHRSESLKVMAVLAAAFPSQLPEKTAEVWAKELLKRDYKAAQRAVSRVARNHDRITLKRLIDAVRAEERTGEHPRMMLPARVESVEPGRVVAAAALIREIIDGRRSAPQSSSAFWRAAAELMVSKYESAKCSEPEFATARPESTPSARSPSSNVKGFAAEVQPDGQ